MKHPFFKRSLLLFLLGAPVLTYSQAQLSAITFTSDSEAYRKGGNEKELQPFSGRLAYSADGNYHDEDDIAANAFALMLLAKSGYKNRLVHFEYGNHIWYTKPSQLNRLVTATKTAAIKFGFDTSIFFNCIENRFAAYDHLKNEILKSDKNNTLSILGAGPMHTIYQAIKRASQADPEKLKYVTVVSHSPATGDSSSNNEHGLYDNRKGKDPLHSHQSPEPAKVWDDIQRDFPSVNLVIIRGQNGPPDIKLKGYDFCAGYNNITDKWMESFPDDNVQWVWKNMNDVFKYKADVSDAGMMWYWLTGGDQYGNFEKVKQAFTHAFIVNQNFNHEKIAHKPRGWSVSQEVTVQQMPGEIYTNRGIRVEDNSAAHPAYAARVFDGKPDIAADFNVMFPASAANDFHIELKTTDGVSIMVIKAAGDSLMFKNRNGEFENLGAVTGNKLHHLTLEADKLRGICSIVLDGRIVKDKVKTSHPARGNINQVKFTTGRKYKGVVYVDYLQVYIPQ